MKTQNNSNMQNTECKRPRMERILDLLITLTLALLLLASYARGGEDELIKHLNSPDLPYAKYMTDGWNKVDIKAKLPEFIDYSSNPGIISPILEKIADNPVGKLTLCLLYQARHNMPKERLKIFVEKREPEYDYEEKNHRKGTRFNGTDFSICLDFKQMKNSSIVAYLNRNVYPWSFYEADSHLHHELLHALHYTVKTYKHGKQVALWYIYRENKKLKNLWTDDEELYTIVGKFLTKTGLAYDPLNSNLYEAFKKKFLGRAIEQRLFHCDYTHYEKEQLHDREWQLGLELLTTNFVDFIL